MGTKCGQEKKMKNGSKIFGPKYNQTWQYFKCNFKHPSLKKSSTFAIPTKFKPLNPILKPHAKLA